MEVIAKKPKRPISQRIIGRLKYESVILPLKESILWQLESRKKQDLSWQKELKTICILLGPYRNLTTLTASIFSLHPHCQTLNHAGTRILPNKQLNFLKEYSDGKFKQFCQFAIFASQRGKGGHYGGSMLYSHAFNNSSIRNSYKKRYNDATLKQNIQCILWKESLRVNNFIRKNKVNLENLFRQNELIRFLLPIRNPIDCAVSNYITWHSVTMKNLKKDTIIDILDEIINEIKWFLDLEKKYPERFKHFFQDELGEQTLTKLREYLKLSADGKWLQDSIECIKLKKSYNYKNEWIKVYNDLIEHYLNDHPVALKHLKQMI
jgi:hypothetical protein